ncbi:MAG: S-type pyocin domain-containing protein [Providencia rustigianii]|uniref:S-type pyocin domain-containing protein n=1 Tax=Providencia rustigianii TaxID=158850 RepID=UPI003F3A3FAB
MELLLKGDAGMPENNYIGSATSRTNIGTSTTTVYVTVPKLRFFMEPRALSFAPTQSIPLSPPATAIPKPSISPKDALDVLTQVVKAPNPMTILLMGLFYSPSVGDATMDRIFIGRPLEKRLIFGGFSRSVSTVSTYDYTSEAFLREIAAAKSTVTTRVRFRVIVDEETGNPKIVGYEVDEKSGLDRVRVRFAEIHEDGTATFSDPEFKGQFVWDLKENTVEYNDYTAQEVAEKPILGFQSVKFSLDNGRRETIIHDGGEIGHTSPPTPLPEPQKIWSLPNPIPDIEKPEITISPIPEQSTGWIEWVPIHETDFNDYVIVDPRGEVPAIYVFFEKEPIKAGEVDYFGKFKNRSRQKLYEVDHIPSKAAVERYLRDNDIDGDLSDHDISILLDQVAAVSIPKEVHQKNSETYGGRNNSKIEHDNGDMISRKELDSKDLYNAAERNWEAIRPHLKEKLGYSEQELNNIIEEIHRLNRAKGWYE